MIDLRQEVSIRGGCRLIGCGVLVAWTYLRLVSTETDSTCMSQNRLARFRTVKM
jgi:hypothetical protein